MTASIGRILLVLASASMIGSLSVGPALGEERHDDRGRGRDRHDDRYRRDYRPVYAPPPVVYVPAPSPGISLFFPLFR
jgi:hypothetical protein